MIITLKKTKYYFFSFLFFFISLFFYSNNASASTPIISNGSPTGILAANTVRITISVQTDVNATCKYAFTSSTTYDDPNYAYLFEVTGGITHSKTLTYLDNTTNGQIFNFFVHCNDGIGNINQSPYIISFAVAADSEPTLKGGSPNGILPATATQTLLEFFSSEFVTCKYSTSPGINFDLMTLQMQDNGTYHSLKITNLVSGSSYTYYIRCAYPIGTPNTSDYPISFSVANIRNYSISDFTAILPFWMHPVDSSNQSDINYDKIINAKDLGLIMTNWK